MNETNNLRAITLKDLWDLLVRRGAAIALAAVIAAGGLLAADLMVYRPQYASTATMYILRHGSADISSGEAASELNLALRLVCDCDYFLRSRTVLEDVIRELDLDMTYDQLYTRVSIANPSNTRVLEVTVRGDTPEQAKAIVDRICDIGPGEIEAALGYGQLKRYEYGTLPVSPSNTPNVLKYAAVAIGAAAAAYVVFLLMFLLDDRIRTDEDIEKLLGLPVLAQIPGEKRG